MVSRALCRVVWIPSALGVIGAVAAFAMKPYEPPAVAELIPWANSDKSLAVSHPSNWKARTLDMSGTVARATFEPSKAVHFDVSADLAGSLKADSAKSSSGAMSGIESDVASQSPEMARQMAEIEKKHSPLHSVHEDASTGFEATLPDYHEESSHETQLAGMEALYSDFTMTVSGIFAPRPVVGRRYTAIANDRRISVFYYCPKEAVEKLGPVFAQMVKSVHVGQGG